MSASGDHDLPPLAISNCPLTRVSGAHSIAAGAASGTRRDLGTREEVVAAIRAHCDDPDDLAEAAAVLLVPYGLTVSAANDAVAVELLCEAGADPDAVERHVAARRARPGSAGLLATLADGLNHRRRQLEAPTD